MSILVLGGAGYIGSHAVNQLIDKDYDVVVVDNLATGHEDAINKKAKFYKGDIRDKEFMQVLWNRGESGEGGRSCKHTDSAGRIRGNCWQIRIW